MENIGQEKKDNFVSTDNSDWFNDTSNVDSVDGHLLKTKTIGVNTVGSSLGRHYDIVGTPPNPKFVVSPWMNSSIEPDTNISTGSSLEKHHDIIGTPPNPKFTVGPWLESSIEPDTNIRSIQSTEPNII